MDSLAGRMLLASVTLACLVVAVFAVLAYSVIELRDATRREAQSKDLVASTLELQKLVVDLETGLNGYALTGRTRFLRPWVRSREQLPAKLAEFRRLAVGDPERVRNARRLMAQIRAYELDYAIPLVRIAREDPAAAADVSAQFEGNTRMSGIRALFTRFLATEDELATNRAAAAGEQARTAIAAAVAGLVGSAALIVLFGVYLARSIGRPVREAAAGAERLAGGELDLRLAEEGPGEVGALTRSFNSMAGDLATQRRELEEQNAQLRESEQLKTEVISLVSHEVRTPLASVLGFTSLLLRRDFDAETRQHYLEIIDAQSRRLSALVDDFLDVQRLDERRLALERQRIDLAELLREQVRLFEGQSGKHRLELELIGPPLLVSGDGNRLAQVVANLLSNAIKYSPDGGLVEVKGAVQNGTVRVTVRDEGLGIADDQHDRIFTKFFRGNAAASGITGSGLGLAFTRAIVEAHGGRIGFTSKPDAGSMFWVELPAASAS